MTATWKTGTTERHERRLFHLRDLTIDFLPHAVNLVTGPLGYVKSALLLTILGETTVVSGKVIAPRSTPQTLPTLGSSAIAIDPDAHMKADWLQSSIAYTPQVPYIEHDTVRSNICFGQVFWKERYDTVIRACCLIEDIQSWPDGDLTELGEGGHVISGRLRVFARSDS